MKVLKYVFCYCSILILSGCSETDPPSSGTTLFADYYIRYLEEERLLRAEASFSEGDSLQNAKPANLHSVFFQDGAMELRNLGARGERYRSERKTGFDPPFTFTVKQHDNTSESYEIEMAPILGISVAGNLKKSGETLLRWEGDPLTGKESLVLILTDPKNQTAVVNVNGPLSENKLTVKGTDLQKLTPGEIKLYLVKKKRVKEKRKNVSTVSAVEFYTKTILTALED